MSNQMTASNNLPMEIENNVLSIGSSENFQNVLKVNNIDRDAFSASAYEIKQAMRGNPKLLNCSAESLIGSALTTCKQGISLDPNAKQAYLIPYGNTCKLEISYIGLINLIYKNCGATVQSDCVHQNELDSLIYKRQGTKTIFEFTPTFGVKGELAVVVSSIEFPDGKVFYETMTMEDIMKVKNASKSGGSGPWKIWFNEMAKKSCIRRMLKTIPMTQFNNSIIAEVSAQDEKGAIDKDQGFEELAREYGYVKSTNSNQGFNLEGDTVKNITPPKEDESVQVSTDDFTGFSEDKPK